MPVQRDWSTIWLSLLFPGLAQLAQNRKAAAAGFMLWTGSAFAFLGAAQHLALPVSLPIGELAIVTLLAAGDAGRAHSRARQPADRR